MHLLTFETHYTLDHSAHFSTAKLRKLQLMTIRKNFGKSHPRNDNVMCLSPPKEVFLKKKKTFFGGRDTLFLFIFWKEGKAKKRILPQGKVKIKYFSSGHVWYRLLSSF